MTLLTFKAMLLMILSAVSAFVILNEALATPGPVQAATAPSIPVQTDDGLDPINLIWTGYAPAWWVASNIVGWSDSAYCSGPKTVNGAEYNYTLEHPDPNGIGCFGPRDHVRIWDMGTSPTLGRWSIGSAHHEHTVCDPVCHHVVDSWEGAEAEVRASFMDGQATVSISNFALGNAAYYQGVFNDGNATMVQLKPFGGAYPVVFNEQGLSNGTSWSVTMNGTTLSSPHPDVTFWEPNGTYLFAVSAPSGYEVTPSSGTITVNGAGASQTILFRPPWSSSSVTVYSTAGKSASILFSGNATVAIPSVRLAATGNTVLSFEAREIGTRGVLNVTIPKTVVPLGSSIIIYIDSARNDHTKITEDVSHYYVFFLLPYGTHSVELQFVPPGNSYLEYILGGALAAGILAVLFLAFKMKVWRNRRPTL